MNQFETTVESVKQDILKSVEASGIYKKATCDTNSYGWSKDIHVAHETLQRRGIDGIHLTRQVNWEVTDWTATQK